MSDENYGSIDKALSGDYEFSIGSTISEAWAKTKGAKWPINIALSLYFLAFIGIFMLTTGATVMTADPTLEGGANPIVLIAMQIGQNLILLPIFMGIAIMGIKRSVDAPITSGSIFDYYSKMFPLLFTMILMYIMIFIGFILLILPGIYLAVAYYMAMPLVAEKGMGPWEALETSRKAVTHRWFSVFGLFFVLSLIMAVSMIPLGLGTIWTIPMMIVAFGILYRNMFGVESETIA